MSQASSFLFHSVNNQTGTIKQNTTGNESQNNKILLLEQVVSEQKLFYEKKINSLNHLVKQQNQEIQNNKSICDELQYDLQSYQNNLNLSLQRIKELENLRIDFVQEIDIQKAQNLKLSNEISEFEMNKRLIIESEMDEKSKDSNKLITQFQTKISMLYDIINKQEVDFALQIEEKDIEIIQLNQEINAHKETGNQLITTIKEQETYFSKYQASNLDYSPQKETLQALMDYKIKLSNLEQDFEIQSNSFQQLTQILQDIQQNFSLLQSPQISLQSNQKQVQEQEKQISTLRKRLFDVSLSDEKHKKRVIACEKIIEEYECQLQGMENENEIQKQLTLLRTTKFK